MVEIKICNKCKEEKNISDFSKKYKTKEGIQKYQPICKVCFNLDSDVRRNLPGAKEKRDAYDKEFYIKNRKKILEYKKQHHIDNQKEILKKKKIYRDNNKDKILKYRKNNKEIYANSSRRYRQKHPHIVAWRNILHRTLKYLEIGKKGDTKEMLGYSAATLKHHIEKQFTDGMTWENHGEWHIDHIFPLTKFPKDTDVSEVNALNNLQPLWKDQNWCKSNKIF